MQYNWNFDSADGFFGWESQSFNEFVFHFKNDCLISDSVTWYRLQHINPNTKIWNVSKWSEGDKSKIIIIIVNILWLFHFHFPFPISVYHSVGCVMCREEKIECRNRFFFFFIEETRTQNRQFNPFSMLVFPIIRRPLTVDPRMLCHLFMTFKALVPRQSFFFVFFFFSWFRNLYRNDLPYLRLKIYWEFFLCFCRGSAKRSFTIFG